MCKLISVFLFALSILGTTIASTNLKENDIDVSDIAQLYVDYAPFVLPSQIEQQEFKNLKGELRSSKKSERVNSRYWLRIDLNNLRVEYSESGYLYFGTFDRILIYQSKNNSLKLKAELGALYKKSSYAHSPHFHLLPLTLLDKDRYMYVQLSSGFKINDPLQTIKASFIPLEGLNNFNFQSSFDKNKGVIQLGLVFFLFFLAVTCSFYCLIFSSTRLVSFIFLCIALLLYSLRHIEGIYSTSIFWAHFDEGLQRYEQLCRVFISTGFTVFALLNFNLGKYKKHISVSSGITILVGLISAIYYALIIGPYSNATQLSEFIYFSEILLTILNSIALLFLIWRYDDRQFGKPFVMLTFGFLMISYLGLWLNTTWLGQLDNFYSSKLYSTYAIFIYMGSLSYVVMRQLKRREISYSHESLENRRLTTLQESQAKLFSDISHEFRNPLTIIKAALDDSNSSFNNKEVIKKNSEQLLSLAESIRNISYNKDQKIVKNYIQDDFVAYTKFLIESFESLADQKQIELIFQSSHQEYIMEYDEDGIRKIVSNLISNAIAFTQESGFIEVGLHFEDNMCTITCSDNGMGISKQNLEKIFNRHFTDHSLVVSDYNGSGLGLALVKEELDKMHGSIDCSSQENQGTIFTIQLPAIMQSKMRDTEDTAQRVTDDEQPLLFASDETVILVAEDNVDVQDYIKSTLEIDNRIITANNGKKAYDLAKNYIPDMIISDLVMPNVNGFQLIELLKQDQRTDHIPIILLTGKSSQEDRELGLSYGVDSYLTKPFSKVELQLTVSNILRRVKILQERFGSGNIVNRQEIPDWLQSLNDILANKIEEDLSVEDLSKQLFLSRTQLHRKIKALTGKSVSQYIKSYKINKAKKMLMNQNHTVTDVAFNLGYKNAGHFATDFKKHVGQSPTDFRRIS